MDILKELVNKHKNIRCEPNIDLSCPKGWTSELDALLLKIDTILEGSSGSIEILQMKQKLGGFRFYYKTNDLDDLSSSIISDLIEYFEISSPYMCEDCGSRTASVRDIDGWRTALCPGHYKDRCQAAGITEYPYAQQHDVEDLVSSIISMSEGCGSEATLEISSNGKFTAYADGSPLSTSCSNLEKLDSWIIEAKNLTRRSITNQ